MKFPRFLSLIILLAALLHAREGERVLRVGISLREPFAFYDENGSLIGFDIDLVHVVAALSGYRVQWCPMNINELIPSIVRGEIDAIAGGFYVTEERENVLAYTRPYAYSGLVLVIKHGVDIQSPEDIVGRKIGVVSGSAGDSWAERAHIIYGEFQVVRYPSSDDLLRALLSGEIDVAVDDYIHSYYFLQTKGLGKLTIVGPPLFLSKHKIAIAVRKGNEKLRRALDGGLADLMSMPLFDRFYSKWLLQKPPYFLERYKKRVLTISGLIVFLLSIIFFAFLYRRERAAKKKLDEITRGTALAFATAVELKNDYLRGHSQRVAEYARQLAKKFKKDNELLYLAALLHDVGKIVVPDAILDKPGELTEEEKKIIMKHPEISYFIVKELIPAEDVANWIKAHHERWDGKGYPQGLKGEKIPFEARILAVADAFDALTTEKPYRRAYSVEEAKEILKNGAGKQWDPEVARVAVETLEKINRQPEIASFYKIIDRIKKASAYTNLRLKVLYRIGEEIRNLGDIDTFLHKVLQAVKEVIPNNVKLALVLNEGEDLVVRAQLGFKGNIIGVKLPKDKGITRWAFEHCEPVLVNDVEKDPRYFPTPGEQRIGSEMAVPLVVGGKPIGVLDAEATEKNAFTEEDLMFLQMVTTAIAGAIETARLYHKRERAALYDSLTGAKTYLYFTELFQEEKERALSEGYPISIVFIDANGLKAINDKFGHKIGDESLKTFVKGLEELLRPSDIIARYGGDEFIVMMPRTSKDEAIKIFSKVKEVLSKRTFEVDGLEIPYVEFSYGVSEFPTESENLEELIKLADARMYKDKSILKSRK